MDPFFSVIIPTLNEEKSLPLLLNSLIKQDFKDFEVIVVDGGSTDQTVSQAKKFMEKLSLLKIIVKKTRNVSMARNLGAKKARGKFLVFFDSDVEVEDKFFSLIRKLILKYHLGITTVWNRPKSQTKLSGRVILYLLNIAMTVFQKLKPAANGPCIIIKKDVFEKIGGFDEEIVFGEDFDLIQRANRLKVKFKVFSRPLLYVSTRRFDKEGFLVSLYKSIKALIYQLLFGPIKKPIFSYKMGGQYYK